MSSALATLSSAELQTAARFGTGTAVQTLEGSVSAFFALESFDRRRGVATYSLRVVNRTSSALVCRTWVLSRTGDAMLAHPIFVEVAPLGTSSAHVPVWPRDFASFDRAIAEVTGDGVHCIVEAPSPVRTRSQRPYIIAAALSLAGIVLLGAAAALRAATPRITAFAVPPEALAGTTVRAEYDAGGAGRLAYVVTAPDGRTLQGGSLSGGAGTIPIAIPASNEPGAYTLQMTMSGLLGTQSATRVLNAMPRGRAGAQIASISVTPAVAKPGQVVNVAYSASGDGGYARLVGADGTVWQQRAFSSDGAARFTIPTAPSLREMRVVLHVEQGRTTAQSMAGIVVAGASPATALAAVPQVSGDDNPGAPAATSDANETFEVLTPEVKSGGSIHVRILSPRNGIHLALTDAQSHELGGVDVGAEADSITLRAPVVAVPTRYTIVATFTDGFGQESVVAPVTVTP